MPNDPIFTDQMVLDFVSGDISRTTTILFSQLGKMVFIVMVHSCLCVMCNGLSMLRLVDSVLNVVDVCKLVLPSQCMGETLPSPSHRSLMKYFAPLACIKHFNFSRYPTSPTYNISTFPLWNTTKKSSFEQ